MQAEAVLSMGEHSEAEGQFHLQEDTVKQKSSVYGGHSAGRSTVLSMEGHSEAGQFHLHEVHVLIQAQPGLYIQYPRCDSTSNSFQLDLGCASLGSYIYFIDR